jgi:hypothetical protein
MISYQICNWFTTTRIDYESKYPKRPNTDNCRRRKLNIQYNVIIFIINLCLTTYKQFIITQLVNISPNFMEDSHQVTKTEHWIPKQWIQAAPPSSIYFNIFPSIPSLHRVAGIFSFDFRSQAYHITCLPHPPWFNAPKIVKFLVV